MDLAAFITAERRRYRDEDDNRFAFSIAQVSRYVRFLEIVQSRYEVINNTLVSATRRWMDQLKEGPSPLTLDQQQEIEDHWKQEVALHLEIESYYLFADILLDKVAHFVEDYFGPERRLPLRSHHHWCKAFEKYCEAKRLIPDPNMLPTAVRLEALIGDYRDKQITHLKAPRAVHATMISGAGSSSINVARLYPRESDKLWANEATIHDLVPILSAYLSQLVSLIEHNRQRTKFKLQ